MKESYDSLCQGLKTLPIFRLLCVFALIVSFCEVVALAIIHQCTGEIPSINTLNLLICHWHLPFEISRLWDILPLPLFIYLSFKHERYREDQYFRNFGHSDYGPDVVSLTQGCLFGAMLGSNVFGILYLIPMFAVTCIMWIIFAICLACIEIIVSYISTEL